MLPGKRVIEKSSVELEPVTLAGSNLNNIKIIAENGTVVLRLEVGLEDQGVVLLAHDFSGGDDSVREYIPYTIRSDKPLDSYSCEHIQRLLSDIIYYNTGLVVDLVGLYYDDKKLGYGVLENYKIELTEKALVKKTPINLSETM